ncbi:hypothetical protein BKK79_25050 [Cupriavidus sp. USMAA2-4]|uniref:phosphoglycerate mutase family protein n=1 Tax=Cupriavidus sp. USMAA2-4 TaxID=876364 RepID=UPI0008A6B046|nr:phosphoglycerate mutase family protein [Cupriavidus sp. USMAA2-4]AOY95082.1 hypothetical protein BKK79_25050 [Cupriavidus sp. USMAA2-4]
MSLQKVMLIRHAEKPSPDDGGVDESGKPDSESLSPRGWQRAGALVRFFYRDPCPAAAEIATPDVIFAAGVGSGSQSRRSMQTVSPLSALLHMERSTPLVTQHLKDDVDGLVADVKHRDGAVLIAWEHKLLAQIVNHLSDQQLSPAPWPDDRFDMVWILVRAGKAWNWRQVPQRLLAGDSS